MLCAERMQRIVQAIISGCNDGIGSCRHGWKYTYVTVGISHTVFYDGNASHSRNEWILSRTYYFKKDLSPLEENKVEKDNN